MDHDQPFRALPEPLLHAILRGTQRHMLGTLAAVCTEWRSAVLQHTRQLRVGLTSDAGAASLAGWLQRHGHQLQELNVATAGLFGRHCSDATRLALFHALAAAAPAAPAAPGQHHSQLQLTRLVVSARLSAADAAAIAALPAPRLVALELHGSRTRKLASEGVRALGCLTQLTSLELQQLGVGDADLAALGAQLGPQLLELSLPGNNLTSTGAAAVATHCAALRVLDLSTNRFASRGCLEWVGGLTNLTELRLSGMPITACSTVELHDRLAPLGPRLQRLSVSTCGLASPRLAAIVGALPRLTHLDAASNKLNKGLECLSSLTGLTSLSLARNPLQLSAAKVLGALPLAALTVFESLPAKGATHLAPAGGLLAQHLSSLTLGADPSLNPEGSSSPLLLSKTRAVSSLVSGLAEASKLVTLAVPCTGLTDAGGKLLAKLGASLVHLNLSYNCLSPAGLRFARELPLLQRLELRAMRPELTDDVCGDLTACKRLTHLDVAHNDLSSVGVKQLGCAGLARLQHLDLRANVQVEKWAVLLAAQHLTRLTHLSLLELSDVSGRAFRPTFRPPGEASGAGGSGVTSAAATDTAGPSSSRGSRAAPAGGGGATARWQRPHADLWAALPNLDELLVEAHVTNVGRGGRVMLSTA